jgi:hypothetical protein
MMEDKRGYLYPSGGDQWFVWTTPQEVERRSAKE